MNICVLLVIYTIFVCTRCNKAESTFISLFLSFFSLYSLVIVLLNSDVKLVINFLSANYGFQGCKFALNTILQESGSGFHRSPTRTIIAPKYINFCIKDHQVQFLTNLDFKLMNSSMDRAYNIDNFVIIFHFDCQS